ncbi:Glycosyl hydrolases family 32 N-terminal domain-containing protein [Eubacterium ruminantium]|nr:Glycosyl hydrolases family 32 N-terminal domain-containing protein [Eubacterium ruminantium]
MIIHLTEKYLWIPTSKTSDEIKLHFYVDGKKIQEIDVRLTDSEPDFTFAMELGGYLGRDIEIKGDIPEKLLERISLHAAKPESLYRYRPKIHFTAEAGWINDPNGLVFADDIYHLYYQWNPYGTEWGNMHWGHAVSKDLITWTHENTALTPDEYGTVYSGCGWPDKENAAGFGENTLLFYYTASGGRNLWSLDRGNLHTQRLAVSTDGGATLQKKGLVLDHITGENRDPKVFWHEESGAYVMMLYLDGNEFAIYRSKDLLHWEESSRFSAEGMWECPDLFELNIDNKPGEKKWVFWSADGYYRIGSFDGFRFTPESDVLSAYDTKLPYAAQTYAGVEGRTISIAWYRTKNDKGGFRGMMSIPMELSLLSVSEGLRIRFKHVSELAENLDTVEVIKSEYKLNGRPVAVVIKYNNNMPAVIKAGDTEIRIDNTEKPVTLILDHGIAEYFAADGTIYGAVETEEDILYKKLTVGEEAEKIAVFTIV